MARVPPAPRSRQGVGNGRPDREHLGHAYHSFRLHTDGILATDTEECETYGHDLLTVGSVTEQEHRAMAPAGRAFLESR